MKGSLFATSLLAVAATVGAEATVHAAEPKYYFQIKEVTTAPDVDPAVKTAAIETLKAELASRPEWASDIKAGGDQAALTERNCHPDVDRLARHGVIAVPDRVQLRHFPQGQGHGRPRVAHRASAWRGWGRKSDRPRAARPRGRGSRRPLPTCSSGAGRLRRPSGSGRGAQARPPSWPASGRR